MPHTAYQIDYAAVNCGKIVAASKRHIRFKFGFTNIDALSNGKTGQECRGSEHEVSVTWSLSSGKQAIAFDQREVYFDVGNSTQTKLSHAWQDKYGHKLEVKIHAANMSTKSKADPDWKQYDLIINGVSFFNMPKIFEIGVFPREGDVPELDQGQKFDLPPSETSTHAQAGVLKINSLSGATWLPDKPAKQPEPVGEVDLLSFDELNISAPGVATSAAHPPTLKAPAPTEHAPALATPQNASAWTQDGATGQTSDHTDCLSDDLVQPYQHSPSSVQASFAPPQTSIPSSNAFIHSTTQTQVNKNCFLPATRVPSQNALQPNPETPHGTSSMLAPAQPVPSNFNVDGAMKNLVDMDNLLGTSPPPATKESIDSKMQDMNAHKSLGQLRGSNSRSPKRPVMNPFNASMVHDQHISYNGNASELQQYSCSNKGSYNQTGFTYQ